MEVVGGWARARGVSLGQEPSNAKLRGALERK